MRPADFTDIPSPGRPRGNAGFSFDTLSGFATVAAALLGLTLLLSAAVLAGLLVAVLV